MIISVQPTAFFHVLLLRIPLKQHLVLLGYIHLIAAYTTTYRNEVVADNCEFHIGRCESRVNARRQKPKEVRTRALTKGFGSIFLAPNQLTLLF